MSFNIRDLQKKELIILHEFKTLCERNNLKYYIAFGTLLGAVRHQGFIPWDDDIDVCMPYGDYLEFESLCKNELKEGFYLQTRDSQPEAGLTYDKLRLDGTTLIVDYMSEKDIHHGINIDIYPLYNVPDNKVQRKRQLISAAFYMLCQEGKAPENHGRFMKYGCGLFLFFVRGKLRNMIKRRCHKAMAAYEGEETGYKAMLFGNLSYCRKLYPVQWFKTAVPLKFEDDTFSAPIGYDQYLKSFYGDYMRLPSVEERTVKLEHIILVDTKRSYTQYKYKAYLIGKKK